jgi:hypothetical protein
MSSPRIKLIDLSQEEANPALVTISLVDSSTEDELEMFFEPPPTLPQFCRQPETPQELDSDSSPDSSEPNAEDTRNEPADLEILGLDALKDKYHVEFESQRKVQGTVIRFEVSQAKDLIPPASIACSISYSRGSLNTISQSYTKVLRCAGVWKCPNCPFRARPNLSQMDPLSGLPLGMV